MEHGESVEERRRTRARGILKKVKGRGHLSDESGGEEGDSEEASGSGSEDDAKMDDEPLAKAPMRSAMTLVSQKPTTPFNASGSLGVVHTTPAVPIASTSNHNPADATSARPPIAPAKIPATLGSGLAAGATVVVVKRKKKEKGRMRALAGREKGKGKEVESDFDSSAESEMGTDSEGEKEDSEAEEGGGSDAGSWKGIASDDEVTKVASDVP